MPQHRTLLRLVQAALALGLLVLVWRLADGAQAMRQLARAEPGWLLAGGLALTLQTVLSALRWQLTAAQLGLGLTWHKAVREYYLSQVVNQLLPGGVLGDAGRAYRSRAAAGLMAAGQAVVFERLAGQIALFVVLALGFVATAAVPGGLDWPGWAFWPVAGLTCAGLVLPVLLRALLQIMPQTSAQPLRRQIAAFRHAVLAPPVRARQAGLSLAAALCNIAGFLCCLWAIGVFVPPTSAMVLVPLILLSMLIPLTISGWGLREGAAAALLPLAGASASDGLAASIAFGLVFLAASLPGALWLLLTSRADVRES